MDFLTWHCPADLQGKYDDLPEMAFYMVGDIKEVQEKADRLAKEVAARKDEGKKVRTGPQQQEGPPASMEFRSAAG
jgi:F-type H+-transporting ATPase subunit beta